MKCSPPPSKRRGPLIRPIEPERPPEASQGPRRRVSERVRQTENRNSGFSGFSPSILLNPPKRWVVESAEGRPRPRCEPGAERNARVQGIVRLDPGMRPGKAGNRNPGARNRLVAPEWVCGALRAHFPDHAETRPPRGKARCGRSLEVCAVILFGWQAGKRSKLRAGIVQRRKWAGGTPMRGKRPAEGFHGYRCKIVSVLRVPGCLSSTGMIGKPASGGVRDD